MIKLTKRKILGAILAIAFIFVGSLIAKPSDAFAEGLDVTAKSQYYNIMNCYDTRFMSPIYSGNWYGINSLVDTFSNYDVWVYNNGSAAESSCYTLVNDTGRVPQTVTGSQVGSQLTPFMEAIGYNAEADPNAAGETCYRLNFSGKSKTSSVKICAKTNSEGKIEDGTTPTVLYEKSNGVNTPSNAGAEVIQVEFKNKRDEKKVVIDCKLGNPTAGGCSTITYDPSQATFKSVVDDIYNQVITGQASQNGQIKGGWRLDGGVSTVPSSDAPQFYTKNGDAMKALSYLSNNAVTSKDQLELTSDEKIKVLENLLKNDLGMEYYGGSESIACGGLSEAEAERLKDESSGYKLLNRNGKGCWVTGNGGFGRAYNSSTGFYDGSQWEFGDVVDALNALLGEVQAEIDTVKEDCNKKYAPIAAETLKKANEIVKTERNQPGTIPTDVLNNAKEVIKEIRAMGGEYWEQGSDGQYHCKVPPTLEERNPAADPNDPTYTPPQTDPITPGEGDEGSGGSAMAGCLEADSALTWVLCPTLQVVGAAADWLYQSISENWLPVEANLVANNSPVYEAWTKFRDIANIIFAAMLLIVIFSQLTGFGVSNYGIKKMLPTLIVTVVLVNVSFLLCQVVVDLTNIIGAGMGSFMSSLGKLPNAELDGTMAQVGRGILGTLLNSLGIVGIGFAIKGAASVLGAKVLIDLMIPVLIAIVGALISLFFLFLLLAIRKAGIMAAIMLCPIAIICYALPNTKNIFDKWKKLFTSLLLVYPICQILSGGGTMMASIMLGTKNEGALFYITAMLLQVAPVFFLPTLLRNSLSALGNIGARISQMGDRWRNRAVSTMNNSEIAKQAKINRQYANALRPKFSHKLNEQLRKARGIGRVVRGVEDSRVGRAVGQVVNDSRTKRNARAISAYRDMMLANAKAQNIAANTTDQSINEEVDATNYKYQQSLIENAATTMQLGNMSYIDENGNEQKVNVNDMIYKVEDDGTVKEEGSMAKALQYYMAQYNATGNAEMLTKAQAVAKLMFTVGGDGGRTAALKIWEKHNFDGSGNGAVTDAGKQLAQYISRDGKWMADLKNEDNGAMSMISDAAKGEGMKNLSTYHMSGAKKFNPSAINNYSDHFWDSIKAEAAKGDLFDMSKQSEELEKARRMLLDLDQTGVAATQDERISGQLKKESLDHINDIHEIAYKFRQAAGMSVDGYDVGQNGELRKLTRNEQKPLKIVHMPDGWRRAKNQDERDAFGEWVKADANNIPIEGLDPGETARAIEYERQINEATVRNEANKQ